MSNCDCVVLRSACAPFTNRIESLSSSSSSSSSPPRSSLAAPLRSRRKHIFGITCADDPTFDRIKAYIKQSAMERVWGEQGRGFGDIAAWEEDEANADADSNGEAGREENGNNYSNNDDDDNNNIENAEQELDLFGLDRGREMLCSESAATMAKALRGLGGHTFGLVGGLERREVLSRASNQQQQQQQQAASANAAFSGDFIENNLLSNGAKSSSIGVMLMAGGFNESKNLNAADAAPVESRSNKSAKEYTLVPNLYVVDSSTEKVQVNFAAFGPSETIINSVLQVNYKRGMGPAEAVELVKKCYTEMEKRGGGIKGGVAKSSALFILDKSGVRRVFVT